MENPIFVDAENIPLVTHNHEDCEGDHDDDYNDCNTPITNKVDAGTFTTPSPTNEFLILKGLRNRLSGLYVMEKKLGIDETPLALERSVKAATKLKKVNY